MKITPALYSQIQKRNSSHKPYNVWYQTYCTFKKTMKIHEKEKLGRHGQNVKTGHVLRKHPVCKLYMCILK